MSGRKPTTQAFPEPEEDDFDDEEILGDDEEILGDDEDLLDDEDDEDEADLDFNADMIDALTSLLTTEQGDNVCTALVKIAKQMETQNRIMLKMLTAIQQKK